MKRGRIMENTSLVWPLELAWGNRYTLSTTPELEAFLRAGAAVAIGVSDGKDSCACAIAVNDHLNQVAHHGPRVLIHADLGRVEWQQSLQVCRRLATRLGLELVVVERTTGDLLAQWHQRWRDNVRRYADLQCVKLILPSWSTSGMRFCTSELKTTPICRDLVKRFPNHRIVSVIGIRAQESGRRAKRPIVAGQPKLASRRYGTTGLDWHPVLAWTRTEVLDYLAEKTFDLHEAYTVFGSSRVSCAFSVLASQADLKSACSCETNDEVYRALVALEVDSTFSFQEHSWLCDIAPHLLDGDTRMKTLGVKDRAKRRELAERRIPRHLLYEAGWPNCVPTIKEAHLLAEVRREVAAAVGISIAYDDAAEIVARYADLIALKGT
jgi:3'-phosphoadenosine 5'-phosphosulfate sulfotransferase (PAPS reductase)/FAD synthetase